MSKPKVIKISETLFEIPDLNHSVKIQTKQGRTLLLCDCYNHTRFCDENPFCYHKQLVLEFIILNPIKEELNRLIEQYSGFLNLKDAKIDPYIIVDDLENLRRRLK